MIENLKQKIEMLIKEKNVLFLAHNYQRPEVQDMAHHVGDSLELSILASKSDADIILFAGVHFMAESAKILSPDKLVLLPKIDAGCPMADMADEESLIATKKKHPGAAVVSYVNSTAKVKAHSDICCTSANAVRVVQSLDAKKILFLPDRNLAMYTASKVRDKEIIPWPGYCSVHDNLDAKEVIEQKAAHPDAMFMAHPECRQEVLELADYAASTSGMLKLAKESDSKEIIVGTEIGLIHRLEKENPTKEFIGFRKMVCANMKKTGLDDILHALENVDEHAIQVPEPTLSMAKKALDKMVAVPRNF
ncbi:MAG: quinolinate synthase NadA [Deltaproteobacteria bacterium]|nr:quinolinate synthase NadA [Deltaproteobacteria bacterium]